ncbi:MAG: hypothetical protein VYD64_08315 [Pseudomonadota bacterium]|nr:hypothetical protein [Pseudomonadota bacterium]
MNDTAKNPAGNGSAPPSEAQLRYLSSGMTQPGGKLPLFDETGQAFRTATIRSCIDKGWAVPWFDNPAKPDWLVCRLTDNGRDAVLAAQAIAREGTS